MKRNQSKYKYLRDEWRKNNPNYAKEYYEKRKNDLEFKNKANERSKNWQKDNKERANEIHLKYREGNREKLKLASRKWISENKEIYLKNRRISTKNRKLNDPVFKFSENIRSLISSSFKRDGKNLNKKYHTEEILGCSLEFFREYILKLCSERVNLKDFGKKGYHLDHIIPIDSAKSEEDVTKLNHYTNFQPLWWEDNLSKSSKILQTV